MLVSKGITAPTHLTTKLTMADVETVITSFGITSSANHHRQPLPPHKPRRRMTESPKVTADARRNAHQTRSTHHLR